MTFCVDEVFAEDVELLREDVGNGRAVDDVFRDDLDIFGDDHDIFAYDLEVFREDLDVLPEDVDDRRCLPDDFREEERSVRHVT